MSYIIYADLELLIKKVDGCANNPEQSSTTKIGEHIPRGHSMSTIWFFNSADKRPTLYSGKDLRKGFVLLQENIL